MTKTQGGTEPLGAQPAEEPWCAQIPCHPTSQCRCLDRRMGHPSANQIAVALFPEVDELDTVGPWEVLSYWTRRWPEDGWAVYCVSQDGGPVRCAKGMAIGAHFSAAEMPDAEVFIHPGGWGTRAKLGDEEYLGWIRGLRKSVPLMVSVCTGALVYAAAGLLAGRPATTHRTSLGKLAELDPSIDVRSDQRYVDDGDLITSAGISAGIDMALYLVGRLVSPERARQVREGIQYDPEPPY